MADPVGPCPDVCTPWAELEDLPAACQDVDPDTAELYLLAVSGELFERSGRRWPGSCQDTVRPTTVCHYDSSLAWYGWRGLAWQMWNESWGTCGCARGDGGCSMPPRIALGPAPVTSIIQVMQDGVIVPDTSYAVHDFKWLVRTDGEGWPTCQDLKLPSTDDNTFEVTFTYGVMPPAAGKVAAIRLGTELLKALCSDESCALPERVQQITREGVSAVFLDPFFKDKTTGLYEVDAFLQAYNPAGIPRRARMSSPDLPRSRQTRVTG